MKARRKGQVREGWNARVQRVREAKGCGTPDTGWTREDGTPTLCGQHVEADGTGARVLCTPCYEAA